VVQHSVAAVLLFLKQPHNITRFDLALQKCFGSITESLPRRVPHLPQCSYGQESEVLTWPTGLVYILCIFKSYF